MNWLMSNLPPSVAAAVASVVGVSNPSVVYQIKSASNGAKLLAIQSQNIDELLLNNVALAHLRIRASALLVDQLLPALYRLESHLADHRERSLRLKRVVLRISPLAEAEHEDALAERSQLMLDCLHRFVGFHIQVSHAVQAALELNRSDELAHAIVAACRQAAALHHAVKTCSTPLALCNALADVLRRSLAPKDVSDEEHIAGQLGQFWNQNDTGKRLVAPDVRITLRVLKDEVTDLRFLRRKLINIVDRELAPKRDFILHPVKYTGLVCSGIYAAYEITANSRLFGGSGKLEDGMTEYAIALKLFSENSIIEPAVRFYQHIFQSAPVTANVESIAIARSSVREMLVDFTEKYLPDVPEALELAENGSMKPVFDLIRDQAGTPIRSFLQGSLTQAMLIQVQKLKCDVEELMLKSKQTLRAQELNLALVALVPSLLAAAALMSMCSTLLYYWRSRGRELIVSPGQTASFLLAEVVECMLALESQEEENQDQKTVEYRMSYVQQIGLAHVKILALCDLIRHRVLRAPPKVLRRFHRDLDILLDADLNFKRKRQHIKKIISCYTFLTET